MKGLAASTGQSDDTIEAPFISGTFEYGGRAAARRKVYIFANKAQDQRCITDATVQFLGVYKTDKKVAISLCTHSSTCQEHGVHICQQGAGPALHYGRNCAILGGVYKTNKVMSVPSA